jgi:AraC-like DNA-binding protein
MGQVTHFAHQPSWPIRRYVREILWVRSEHRRVQVLLPETSLTVVLRQSGAVSLRGETLPSAIVSGLQQRARLVEHAPNSSLVIVRFTEVGAPAILHDRADLLYNRTVPLMDLLPRQGVDDIQNLLAETGEIRPQVRVIEDFLSNRICAQNRISRRSISPQIEAAVQMIRSSNGQSPIRAIARRLAMSQSALERHFRVTVGATPKNLSRLTRLQHICWLWDIGKNLTEIAFDAGYTDQPHLVRDFRLFTDISPERFFRSASPRNLPTFYK